MLNTERKVLIHCVSILMLLGVSPASADIIDEGYALFDDETSYEWLKMDATLGDSYDNVLERLSSGDLQGWSVASLSDVDQLVTNFLGFGLDSFPGDGPRDFEGASLVPFSVLIQAFNIPGASSSDEEPEGSEEYAEESVSYYMDAYVSDELSVDNRDYDPNTLMQEVASVGSHYNPDHVGFYNNNYPHLGGNASSASWMGTFVYRDASSPGEPQAGGYRGHFTFADNTGSGDIVSTSQSSSRPVTSDVNAPLTIGALMSGLLLFGPRKKNR
jgi:hypothetical protein